jgi:hypothetical protein
MPPLNSIPNSDWVHSLSVSWSNSVVGLGLGRFQMWCEKCQTDVADVTPSEGERARCTKCGTDLVPSQTAQTKPATNGAATPQAFRDARELIARWAQVDELERIEVGAGKSHGTPDDLEKSAVRFDGSHNVQPAAAEILTVNANRQPAPATGSTRTQSAPIQPESTAAGLQAALVDSAHPTNAPHFTAVPVAMADKSSRWVTFAGQILAYVGVGGLTVGTSLVLLGYFAGPSSYATSGWLIATIGQMLLFLGVVTLISSGMEQTTQEVARRIDLLGERLGRIEQVGFVGKSQAPSQQHEPAETPE